LSVDQLSVDQLSVDQLSVDQLSVDQLSVDQLSVDQLSVDQLPWSLTKLPSGKPRFYASIGTWRFPSTFGRFLRLPFAAVGLSLKFGF
jgi:hypothetical protein